MSCIICVDYVPLAKEFIPSNLHCRGDKASLISMFAAEEKPGEEVVRANAERLKGSLVQAFDFIN